MTSQPADEPLLSRARPETPGDLFWAFTAIAMQGFGGVLAVVQRALVEDRRWLTHEEFVEDWAVAQVLPGPNVVNLSVILGDRYFGWRGAVAALAGMLVFPTVIVLALALVYSRFAADPRLAGALRGMGAVAAGLIAATGIKLMPTLRKHPLGPRIGLLFTALVFGAIALLKWPLIGVLALFGIVACAWTYRRIAP